MYTAGGGAGCERSPGLAGGQGRRSGRCWQRAVPVASHTFLCIQLPRTLTDSPLPWERPRRAGPLRGCSGQAMTPWWQATGVTSPCTAVPLGSRGKPSCNSVDSSERGRRAGAVRGLLGGGGCGRGRAGPRSFGSKWTLSEGEETTTGQRCPVGFREAGLEVARGVGFHKAAAETIPGVPLLYVGAYPVCWTEFTRNLPTRASFVIKTTETQTRQERRWRRGVVPTVPAVPVRPAPHSFSSFISTMSVISSAAGMSVMAESSPSTADSFSIFFFCFR